VARRTGPTNLELAENRTWVIALTFMECPFCGFLSQEPGLDRPSVPCPRCDRRGSTRSLFPGYACIEWLKMIGDAYARAAARTRARLDELAGVIRSNFKQDVEASELAAAAGAVRRFFRKSHRPQAAYRTELGALQRRLSLGTQEEAARAFSLLASYSDTSIEHAIVVVLTASLFERLLQDLLIKLLVGQGIPDPEARQTVRKRRRREELQDLFWILTGTRLKKAVGEFGVPGLCEAWQSIADRRNKFLHITSGAISADMAGRAFDIAKRAFALFASLQNRYVGETESASGRILHR